MQLLAPLCCSSDKPGPPAAFDISEITNESCVLAWNPPRDDGGSPITNYIVECRLMDKEEWVKLSATVKHTTFKACKLLALKEYVFRVSAENQYGIGVPTEHTPIIAKYSFGMLFYPHYSKTNKTPINFFINHNTVCLFQILLVLQPESLLLTLPRMQ